MEIFQSQVTLIQEKTTALDLMHSKLEQASLSVSTTLHTAFKQCCSLHPHQMQNLYRPALFHTRKIKMQYYFREACKGICLSCSGGRGCLLCGGPGGHCQEAPALDDGSPPCAALLRSEVQRHGSCGADTG